MSHRSACHSARFPDDDRLRDAGYTILERRRGREAVWLGPRGRPAGQREALAELDLAEALPLAVSRGRPAGGVGLKE